MQERYETRRCDRRRFSRMVCATAWMLIVATAGAQMSGANPVPDRSAREMNERPGQWLANPDPEEERKLVFQFANYGIARGLLSPATIELLEANFDRFAPIMVAAQRPPNYPHQSIQRWYRERADRAEADTMMAVLRDWLTVTLMEAPIVEGMRRSGPPEDVEEGILAGRLAAAEALGDWGDARALPELRSLQSRLPKPAPVLVAAIRRITDPKRADVLAPEPDGRLALRRPRAELDSMTVVWRDEVTQGKGTWRADAMGSGHIWRTIYKGYELDRRNRPPGQPVGSFRVHELKLHFEDGRIVSLEDWGGTWAYQDNGRMRSDLEFVNPELHVALRKELERAGVAPSEPRFIEEAVTLFIHPNSLTVNGIYTFEGTPRDGWLPIRYPVARSGGLGPARIESVELRTAEDNRALPVRWSVRGDDLRIGLEPGSTRTYSLTVRYAQEITGRSATYLITTAREWGRPLHRGWFQVIVDSTVGVPRFEMPFREVPERPGVRRYLFQASPFRPEQDLVVTW